MSTHKAFIVDANKSASVVQRPLPAMRDDYILVKTISIALNPADWKHVKWGFARAGNLVGCDYAGIVEEVGTKVKKQFARGDRVCGFVHGCNSAQLEDGAFAEYIVAKGDVQWKIPDNLSFEQACTLGVSVVTVIQALYQSLEIGWPNDKPEKNRSQILIYGGSSATGVIAIQFARVSGYTVLTTSSPRNFEYLRSLGADYVFDYNDSTVKDEIRKVTHNELALVMDCIGVESSRDLCEEVIGTQGGRYHPLLTQELKRKDIKHTFKMAYTFTGEQINKFGVDYPEEACLADKAYVEKFSNSVFEPLLAQGRIKPIRYRLGRGGLNGIWEGLKELEADNASGEKIVLNVADTV
jgi:NADPH:quinone reductase-like Zn-dependent oxidoreductase